MVILSDYLLVPFDLSCAKDILTQDIGVLATCGDVMAIKVIGGDAVSPTQIQKGWVSWERMINISFFYIDYFGLKGYICFTLGNALLFSYLGVRRFGIQKNDHFLAKYRGYLINYFF